MLFTVLHVQLKSDNTTFLSFFFSVGCVPLIFVPLKAPKHKYTEERMKAAGIVNL